MNRLVSRITQLAAALVVVAALQPPDAAAQGTTTFRACRVPNVGAIYMIGIPGTPSACFATHVEFSWAEGGAVADGSITEAKLADGAVTEAKLDAAVVSAINAGVGTGSITANELADGAVTAAKIAADETWDFAGPDGVIRLTPAFGESAGTTLLHVLESSAWPGPQGRFDGSGADYWDYGLDGVGDFVIEKNDVPVCTLTTSWSCPAAIPDESIGTGQIADGSVDVADLAFNPATQVELNTVTTNLSTAGTINGGANPMNWTKLMSVPAGFADGVDNGYGTAIIRQGPLTPVAAGTSEFVSVSCLAGERAVGGGATSFDHNGMYLKQSYPSPLSNGATPSGWTVSYQNTSLAQAGTVYGWVVCVS